MMRPTKRPETPMCLSDIIRLSERHWLEENGQRCINGIGCRFNHEKDNVGCFVGIFLTHEDAEKLDNHSDGSVIRAYHYNDNTRKILKHYFDLSDNRVLTYLQLGQHLHDSIARDGNFTSRQELFGLIRMIQSWPRSLSSNNN